MPVDTPAETVESGKAPLVHVSTRDAGVRDITHEPTCGCGCANVFHQDGKGACVMCQGQCRAFQPKVAGKAEARPLEPEAAIKWMMKKDMDFLLNKQLGQGQSAIAARNRGDDKRAQEHIEEQRLLTEAILRKGHKEGFGKATNGKASDAVGLLQTAKTSLDRLASQTNDSRAQEAINQAEALVGDAMALVRDAVDQASDPAFAGKASPGAVKENADGTYHITPKQWADIPRDYKFTNEAGKKVAFLGSLPGHSEDTSLAYVTVTKNAGKADPKTTIEHLGGMRALRTMVNARNFVYSDDALTFHFSGTRKANIARVTLEGDDTYTLALFKFSANRTSTKPVAEETGLYADGLRERFEAMTGLDLRVPRIAGKNDAAECEMCGGTSKPGQLKTFRYNDGFTKKLCAPCYEETTADPLAATYGKAACDCDTVSKKHLTNCASNLSGPTTGKAEPCKDCGKPSVCFMGDAFLCEACKNACMRPKTKPSKRSKRKAARRALRGKAGDATPITGDEVDALLHPKKRRFQARFGKAEAYDRDTYLIADNFEGAGFHAVFAKPVGGKADQEHELCALVFPETFQDDVAEAAAVKFAAENDLRITSLEP